MERLTVKHYLGSAYYMKCSEECNVDMDCIDCPVFEKLVDRLGAYEDMGLEPEAVKGMQYRQIMRVINMAPELEGVPFDRLRELAQADREGRVVVLDERKSPCDLCVYNPPSSLDGKPCTMCPAAAKDYEAALGGGGDG